MGLGIEGLPPNTGRRSKVNSSKPSYISSGRYWRLPPELTQGAPQISLESRWRVNDVQTHSSDGNKFWTAAVLPLLVAGQLGVLSAGSKPQRVRLSLDPPPR